MTQDPCKITTGLKLLFRLLSVRFHRLLNAHRLRGDLDQSHYLDDAGT